VLNRLFWRRSEYGYYCDDIYPSILKQKPSLFKRVLLGTYCFFMYLWRKISYTKNAI
jgi:hypothetical protein